MLLLKFLKEFVLRFLQKFQQNFFQIFLMYFVIPIPKFFLRFLQKIFCDSSKSFFGNYFGKPFWGCASRPTRPRNGPSTSEIISSISSGIPASGSSDIPADFFVSFEIQPYIRSWIPLSVSTGFSPESPLEILQDLLLDIFHILQICSFLESSSSSR